MKLTLLISILFTSLAPAQTINLAESEHYLVVTNLATGQAPQQVDNAGNAGATNPLYEDSAANLGTLLVTGNDTGVGAARAVDQKGRIDLNKLIPTAPNFSVLSPGLWIRSKGDHSFVPADLSPKFEYFRFANAGWVRWAANGGPPSFSTTLDIKNSSRVVRDRNGNPLSNQDHHQSVQGVTYAPYTWFGESSRATLTNQRVALRVSIDLPKPGGGTETFSRVFTQFENVPNKETPWLTSIETETDGDVRLRANIPPPYTGTASGPWGWEHSTTLEADSWSPVAGVGTVFDLSDVMTVGPRDFFRPAIIVFAPFAAEPLFAADPIFKGGSDLVAKK